MKTLPKSAVYVLAGLLFLMALWIPSILWHIVVGNLTMQEFDAAYWWSTSFIITNVFLGVGLAASSLIVVVNAD